MNDYTLDFMSPDPDYLIATSFYRDEIDFLVNITGGASYYVCMQTLMRARQNIQARSGKIKDDVAAECGRGLVLVEYLDMDSLDDAVRLALSRDFFQRQKTVNDLPLGIYGTTAPADIQQSKDFYVTKEVKASKAKHIELGPPKTIQATVQPTYLDNPVAHMSVTVEFSDGTRYDLAFMPPESVEECSRLNAPATCLTIPGLVIVPNFSTASIEDVVQWCHRRYYFETLQAAGQ